jgi:hypothetical protein
MQFSPFKLTDHSVLIDTEKEMSEQKKQNRSLSGFDFQKLEAFRGNIKTRTWAK